MTAQELVKTEQNKTGKPRKENSNNSKQVMKNRADCEKAFNEGWPILYAAEKLKLNKNTVHKYYNEFRESINENIEKVFIEEQKYHKAHGMFALRVRMDALEEQLTLLYTYRKDVNDPLVGVQLECQIGKTIMDISNLEQQMHALGMTRTIDISIRKIVEMNNDRSGNNTR